MPNSRTHQPTPQSVWGKPNQKSRFTIVQLRPGLEPLHSCSYLVNVINTQELTEPPDLCAPSQPRPSAPILQGLNMPGDSARLGPAFRDGVGMSPKSPGSKVKTDSLLPKLCSAVLPVPCPDHAELMPGLGSRLYSPEFRFRGSPRDTNGSYLPHDGWPSLFGRRACVASI